jgi:hypothetical protein
VRKRGKKWKGEGEIEEWKGGDGNRSRKKWRRKERRKRNETMGWKIMGEAEKKREKEEK